MLKALDLFSGLGGWSDGLAMEGFDVVGVEIEPKIAMLYKHRCILADVRELNGEGFQEFDLIIGSPPCRDFSDLGRLWGHTWKRKPDPKGEGMSNIKAFLRIVKEAEPRFWLMENVPRAQEFIGKAKVTTYLGVRHMRRSFWGKFPMFLIHRQNGKIVYSGLHKYQRVLKKAIAVNTSGPWRAWERARIPLPVARALGRAVKEAIENE